MTATLASLSTEERAATVAAVLSLGDSAPRVLCLIGPGCAEAATALLAMTRQGRADALAQQLARLRSPLPDNLSLIHRDWIEAALVNESQRVRDAVRGGGDVGDATRAGLQRRVFGALVDMPGTGTGPVAALARVEPARLIEALATYGREALAAALVDAAFEEVAQVAARLGEPHGSALVHDVAACLRQGDEARKLARSAHGGSRVAGADALVQIGVRRLGAAVAGAQGDGCRQLAQRLPRSLGMELAGHAALVRRTCPEICVDDSELATFLAKVPARAEP